MKFLGIDHGNARIGVAVSDPTGLLARPLRIVKHVSRQVDAFNISQIAQEEGCQVIVVGLPLDADGSVGPRARSVNRFIEELRNHTGLSVIPWDESYSTQQARQASIDRGEGRQKRKSAIDDQAAAIILQNYLDNRCRGEKDGQL
jgi:putative Holliday junction resolvase